MRRNIFPFSLAVLLVFVSCVGAASFWPMFQHDPGHTGVAPVSTPEDMQLLWAMDLQGYGGQSPHLVAADGGGVWCIRGYATLRLSSRGAILARGPGSWCDPSEAVLSDGTLVACSRVLLKARVRGSA